MTILAAKAFRASLLGCLEAPYGGNLAAGDSAELLAREFHDGLAGLLRVLGEEAADANELDRPYQISLCQMLMEVWTARGDDLHLKNATGKTRDQWLSAPLWSRAA